LSDAILRDNGLTYTTRIQVTSSFRASHSAVCPEIRLQIKLRSQKSAKKPR